MGNWMEPDFQSASESRKRVGNTRASRVPFLTALHLREGSKMRIHTEGRDAAEVMRALDELMQSAVDRTTSEHDVLNCFVRQNYAEKDTVFNFLRFALGRRRELL